MLPRNWQVIGWRWHTLPWKAGRGTRPSLNCEDGETQNKLINNYFNDLKFWYLQIIERDTSVASSRHAQSCMFRFVLVFNFCVYHVPWDSFSHLISDQETIKIWGMYKITLFHIDVHIIVSSTLIHCIVIDSIETRCNALHCKTLDYNTLHRNNWVVNYNL